MELKERTVYTLVEQNIDFIWKGEYQDFGKYAHLVSQPSPLVHIVSYNDYPVTYPNDVMGLPHTRSGYIKLKTEPNTSEPPS